jgi:hypothetical protein
MEAAAVAALVMAIKLIKLLFMVAVQDMRQDTFGTLMVLRIEAAALEAEQVIQPLVSIMVVLE